MVLFKLLKEVFTLKPGQLRAIMLAASVAVLVLLAYLLIGVVTITFMASIFLCELPRNKVLPVVLILFLIDGIATSAILSLVDIKLMWSAGHT